jgi:hypothetical protein
MSQSVFFRVFILGGALATNFLGNLSAQAQSAINEISLDPSKQSVASQWVSEILDAVATPGAGSFLGPTGASRAYSMLGTAMYDAWSAYEYRPVSTLYADGLIDFDLQRPLIENTQANKETAISYAAFRVLNDVFSDSGLQGNFAAQMSSLGFDPNNTSTDLTTAAGIGNFVAQQLLDFRHQDGSNQLNNYADTTGFVPTNTVDNIINIEAWTPENVPIDTAPGDPDFQRTQNPLHPQWGGITPFALDSGNQFRPPAPEPFLLDPNATVDLVNGTITRADNTVVAIDKNLIGTDINPNFIAQAQQVIDFSASLSPAGETGVPTEVTADGLPGGKVEGETRKLIAEFWEDGGGTPFPPGTWMLFGQKVAEQVNPDLDKDIGLFFNLGNAVFDAGVATWEAKYFYDYTRPVRAIRELGRLGLIGEDPDDDGIYTIFAWGGPEQGTIEIPVTEFLTYQTPGQDPSPPFAEYTSGHSSFSAAAAEVLKLYTGSDDFILGDGTQGLTVTFAPGSSRFEPGFTPMTETIDLSWLTFSEAADEAGISRLYGGIHFEDGDLNSRALGRSVGQTVFARTAFLMNGAPSVPEPGITKALALFGGLFLLSLRKGR